MSRDYLIVCSSGRCDSQGSLSPSANSRHLDSSAPGGSGAEYIFASRADAVIKPFVLCRQLELFFASDLGSPSSAPAA